jgi:hypothetical protein
MISGIRFFGCSGAMGGTPSSRPEPNLELFQYNASFQSSPNRIGFFGSAGAPSSPVVVGEYQNRTHRTNSAGADLGVLINVKYTGSSDAQVSGVSYPNIEDLPGASGTLLMRFREASDSAVLTQNGFLRAIRFVANIPDITLKPLNIDIRAFKAADTQGNAGDSSWTQLADGAGAGSDLTLSNHTSSQTVHDYVVAVSVSPQTVGTKVDFGFLAQLEYL